MSTVRASPIAIRVPPRVGSLVAPHGAELVSLIATSPLAALGPVAILYVALLITLPPGGFYFGDQGVKLLEIQALVNSHSPWVGAVGDPASPFHKAFAGPYYAQVGPNFLPIYPIAYAAAVAPFYWLLGLRGLVVPSILGALLAAYCSGRSAVRLGAPLPGVVVLLVGIATPLPFYAETLWEHSLAVGLISLALSLALAERPVLSGVAVGAAFWIRPELILFTPALCAAQFAFMGWRRALRGGCVLTLATLAMAAPNLLYNQVLVGTWAGPQVSAASTVSVAARGGPFDALDRRLQLAANYFTPVGTRKWTVSLAILVLAAVWLRRRARSPELLGVLLYAAAIGIGIVSMLVEWIPAFSLTDAFPLAFAALAALAWIRDRRVRFLWILTLLFGLGLIETVPIGPKFAGGWGPRYLLPLYPLLSLLAWLALWKHRTRAARLAFLALVAFSVVVQTVGVYRLSVEQERWTALNGELRGLRPNAIATSLWWLPQVAAPTFEQVRWFGVVDPEDLDQVQREVEGFWWVWTTEPTPPSDPRAWQNTEDVPVEGFIPVEQRTLSTRGLHATLFQRTNR